jgi:tetratricopeptide (TPR) repeat protein
LRLCGWPSNTHRLDAKYAKHSKESALRKSSALLILVLLLIVSRSGVGQEPSPPDSQKMWALIIGISRYTRAEPLEFAASDAQSVRNFLATPRGGAIPPEHIFTLLEDRATRKAVEVELEAMQDRIKTGDTVYVFIAGHGYLTNRGIGYFIPSDGDTRVPASTSISFSALKELIELGLGNAGRRILMTDLCHAGRIGPENSDLADKIQNLVNSELLKISQGAPGSYLNLLSSHPREESWESETLKSGVFSHTLLEALNGKAARPGSTVVHAAELVAYLRTEVPKGTGGRQTPMANEDFDAQMPLSFLDRPATTPASTAAAQAPQATILTLVNIDRSPYVRIQWIDPNTQAVSVRLIQPGAKGIQIDSLAPGRMELLLFESENRSRKIELSLNPGSNSFDLAAGRVGRLLFQERQRFQPVSFTRDYSPRFQVSAGNETEETVLLVKLDAGTQVFVDGDFYGTSPGSNRFLLLRALPPGPHNLSLVPSPDREQRYRIKLTSGRQIFDTASGELRAVISVQPPPDFLPVPPSLPPGLQDVYRQFTQALWQENLVEPPGRSAADLFARLSAVAPPALLSEIRNRLVIAMGDRAQRIILKYLQGGDVRWSAASFEEGATLINRMQSLQRATDSMRSRELFFRGRSRIELGQYSAAVAELQQSIRLDPSASHALNALGLALWKQNLLEQAMVPLEQAISLSPAWTYPRNTLGLIYLEQRRYDDAARTFRESIELNPEDSMAFHCLGQLELLLGRLNEAESRLQQAVRVNPGNAYAYATMGQLYQRRQQWDEAERMIRLAIRLEPEELSFQINLAELLHRAGRTADAHTVFRDLERRNPASPTVLLAYASFLASNRQEAEAEATFRKSIDAAPNDPNLKVRLGIFLQQRGHTDDAVRQFRAALQAAPGNTYAHHNLALAYLAQKKVSEAEKELAESIKSDARYPAPLLLLGDLRSVQRRPAEALELYREALSLSIDANQQEETKEKISNIEAAAVAERIEEARKRMEAKQYAVAWGILAETLKSAPDQRGLRDELLALQAGHPEAADLAVLPAAPLTRVLNTAFWKEQLRAESLWGREQKAAAFEIVLAALRSMTPEDRQLVAGVYLNLRNERYGIHGIICRWAQRLIEERNYAGALQLLEEAVDRKFFGVVPGVSPLTVDSLMLPPDNPDPGKFSEFEVAHHPDRHIHEAYAAAHAGRGSLEQAQRYLPALETSNPDLSARLAIARVLRREENWNGAISILKETLVPEILAADKELGGEAVLLLADSQCRAGACAAGIGTLESGSKLFPDNKAIREATRRLKSSGRSSP